MKRIRFLFIAVLVVALIWTGAWFIAAGFVKSEVKKLGAPASPDMAAITCGTLNIGGFPFRFDVTCTQMKIAGQDIEYALPELKLTTRVYYPTHWIGFAKGPLAYADAFSGSTRTLDWSDLQASVRFDGFRFARLAIVGDNLALSDTLLDQTIIAQSPHAELQLFGVDNGNQKPDQMLVQGYLRADNLAAPELNITDVNAVAELELTSIPTDARLVAEPEFLRQWQADNGTLRVMRVELIAPDATANLSGNLALGPDGRPQGDLTLETKGVRTKLDPFLSPQDQAFFLGPQQPDGGNKQQLTIRGGVVLAGIIPIGMMPPLF